MSLINNSGNLYMLMGKFHSRRILGTKNGQHNTVEKSASHSCTEMEIPLSVRKMEKAKSRALGGQWKSFPFGELRIRRLLSEHA